MSVCRGTLNAALANVVSPPSYQIITGIIQRMLKLFSANMVDSTASVLFMI